MSDAPRQGLDAARPRSQPLVLVIDDSATFRAVIGQALRAAGYEVADAASGDEGLRAAARLRPDVLVIDHVLPDLDGTAVIRNIRLDSALRRTPCLLVTADEDPAVEFAALETGADAYVRKDADVSILLARVAALRRDAPQAPAADAGRERRRILLIEPVPHPSGAEVLPGEEYDVVAARGDVAPEPLLAGQVDCVVIAAIDAPMMFEALAAVRRGAHGRHMPILVIGGRDSATEACEALARGADDFVAMSAEPALRSARVRALLRRKDVEAEDRRVRDQLLTRETEAAAARMRAELAERESAFKSRFLAIMSHELRTPLNAILGFAQMLDQGVGGELLGSQRKHVDGVIRSARHLLALVNDVLDLSKVRAGKLPLRMAPVHLHDVTEAVRMTVATLAEQRGITLVMDVPEELPPVLGDAVRIQQIIYNLLSNGIKFTPEGGRVSIEAMLDGDAVRMSVHDTGIGIRREDFARLFRDFERLESGQSQHADGTGLGLSLTKGLVEQHGGRIDVESEVGRGTRFSVWLPVGGDGA